MNPCIFVLFIVFFGEISIALTQDKSNSKEILNDMLNKIDGQSSMIKLQQSTINSHASMIEETNRMVINQALRIEELLRVMTDLNNRISLSSEGACSNHKELERN